MTALYVTIAWRRPKSPEDEPPTWFLDLCRALASSPHADALVVLLPGVPRVGDKLRLGPPGGDIDSYNTVEVRSVLWDARDCTVRLRIQ